MGFLLTPPREQEGTAFLFLLDPRDGGFREPLIQGAEEGNYHLISSLPRLAGVPGSCDCLGP